MVHCVLRWITTEAHRGGEGWGLWCVLWRSQGCGRVPACGRTTNQYQRGAPGSAPSTARAHPRDPVICLDCQLVVDGVLGLAQRWCQRKWRNTTGEAAHADLWAQILELTTAMAHKSSGCTSPPI